MYYATMVSLSLSLSLSLSQLTAGNSHFSCVRTGTGHSTKWVAVVAPQEVTLMSVTLNLVEIDGTTPLTVTTPVIQMQQF